MKVDAMQTIPLALTVHKGIEDMSVTTETTLGASTVMRITEPPPTGVSLETDS